VTWLGAKSGTLGMMMGHLFTPMTLQSRSMAQYLATSNPKGFLTFLTENDKRKSTLRRTIRGGNLDGEDLIKFAYKKFSSGKKANRVTCLRCETDYYLIVSPIYITLVTTHRKTLLDIGYHRRT